MVKATLKGYLENKYLNLLVIMLLAIIILPFFEKFMKPDVPVVSFIFLLGITMTMWALDLPKKLFYSCAAAAVFLFTMEFVLKKLSPGALRLDMAVITWSVYSVFMAACIVIMMRRLFSPDKITMDTIVGGINIYLLMALLWALVYHIINMFDIGAFNLSEKIDFTRLMYFSYNTLTTLGNGDIVPVNRLAMILSSLEAVTGQLYLAIFIATLVGRLISNRASGAGR